MTDEILDLVAAATVKILKKGGQGVVIPGGFVLTAAHCIEWTADSSMALGDVGLVPIKAADGSELFLSPCCVEPVADIAVLAAPDDQYFVKEAKAASAFFGRIEPTPVPIDESVSGTTFPIFVRSHEGKWIRGEATHFSAQNQSQLLLITTHEHVLGGTSGGPIINDRGELVGIVSRFEGETDESNERDGFATSMGRAPRPSLALPLWVWNLIRLEMC